MFILNNAIISITRNKGRNILIGIIILVIACACTITLAINNTANDLINSYESAYEKELTISFDRNSVMEDFDFSNESAIEEMQENFNNISNFTIEDIKNMPIVNILKVIIILTTFLLTAKILIKPKLQAKLIILLILLIFQVTITL